MSLFDDVPPPAPREDGAGARAAAARKQARRPPAGQRREPADTPPAHQAPPMKPAAPAKPASTGNVVTVTELTHDVAQRLRGVGRVAVEGELTALKHAGSGHVYFTLKDSGAALSCVVWKSRVREAARFRLEDGARVVCHGALDVYRPRGSYSLVVDRIEQRGLGELLQRLEELKAELKGRGWFDRSRPLPPLPRTVGLVTSRDADALRDFLRTRSLRWPLYPVRMVHTRVQGPGAAREIASALARLDASGVDVIVLVRGGGALEDLWCFNELAVAEAIWRARAPVVTGVGHESDVTLADLVADVRAHTPTDAAQRVLPDRRALELELERRAGYLVEALHRVLERRIERLERAASARCLASADGLLAERTARLAQLERRLQSAAGRRLERAGGDAARVASRLAAQSPRVWVERRLARVDALAPRLAAAATAPLERRRERLELCARSLRATSPFDVLARGYSITRRAGGAPVRAASELAPGEELETLLAEGLVRSRVESLEARRGDETPPAPEPADAARVDGSDGSEGSEGPAGPPA